MKESLMDTVSRTQAEITDLGITFFHWKVDQSSGNARRPEQTDLMRKNSPFREHEAGVGAKKENLSRQF